MFYPKPLGALHCGMMSKVSSVSDGSLFRVKCMMKRLKLLCLCSGFGLVKPCALLCVIRMSKISLLCSLFVAFLLRPSEDLKDCLVEVIVLVGKYVMACSSDHLKNTKTHSRRRVRCLEIKLSWPICQNVCKNLSHGLESYSVNLHTLYVLDLHKQNKLRSYHAMDISFQTTYKHDLTCKIAI